MTTSTRVTTTADSPAVSPPAPPPKLRRRPGVTVIGIVAICLGAVIAGWTWTVTSDSHEVVVAKTTIERGSVIEHDDLTTARINSDPALSPVSADKIGDIVGQRASVDIAQGSALTPDSYAAAPLPSDGKSVVGVALTPAQAPGQALASGDRVRVVVTPGQDGDAPGGTPLYSEAEVAAVHVDETTGGIVVDLLVSHEEAAVLAARISTGHVALVLDSRER